MARWADWRHGTKNLAELCRTSEDLTPEDRAAELLPISVQQLYVLLRQGKSEEAESVLEEISVDEYVNQVGSLHCD
jgi:signal recognition particle subunit SRP72